MPARKRKASTSKAGNVSKKQKTVSDCSRVSGGKKKKVAKKKIVIATPADPEELALSELLSEQWLHILEPVISVQPGVAGLIGKNREPGIFPVRELTFRALAANPPEKFTTLIFGEAPYPRLESNTGIALFDGKFKDWAKLGTCASLRAMIKSACMWKNPKRIHRKSKADEVRKMVKELSVVQVSEWFQATLVQGCLWLNTALTAGGSLSKAKHKKFWKPIMEAIVRALLESKKGNVDGGYVFVLWGRKPQSLKPTLSACAEEAGVPVRFVEGWNPAASGYGQVDFCDKDNFGMINDALTELGLPTIDWLPVKGWDKKFAASAVNMGNFIKETEELLQVYLDRIAGVGAEGGEKIPEINGVMKTKTMLDIAEAVASLNSLIPSICGYVKTAKEFVEKKARKGLGLSKAQIAAVYLYTTGSKLYKMLNASLRDTNRSLVKPYFPFLKLFITAIQQLEESAGKNVTVWRGVKLDLRKLYKKGKIVTWWGVSSCTIKRSVAEGFMGSIGLRMLFKISARCVSIKQFSAFAGEEEYVLRPGTQLKVMSVTKERSGMCLVTLSVCKDLPEKVT